jgi:hypothetical protein
MEKACMMIGDGKTKSVGRKEGYLTVKEKDGEQCSLNRRSIFTLKKSLVYLFI